MSYTPEVNWKDKERQVPPSIQTKRYLSLMWSKAKGRELVEFVLTVILPGLSSQTRPLQGKKVVIIIIIRQGTLLKVNLSIWLVLSWSGFCHTDCFMETIISCVSLLFSKAGKFNYQAWPICNIIFVVSMDLATLCPYYHNPGPIFLSKALEHTW